MMNSDKAADLVKGSPGLVFNELYTHDIKGCVSLFTHLFGFTVIRDEGGFVELRSPTTILLLNDGHDLESTHRFFGKVTGREHGQCVEIVFVVQDLERTHKLASELSNCKVTKIVLQDWGLKDFRITTQEGFYLRVTEQYP